MLLRGGSSLVVLNGGNVRGRRAGASVPAAARAALPATRIDATWLLRAVARGTAARGRSGAASRRSGRIVLFARRDEGDGDGGGNNAVSSAMATAKEALNTVASFVPESVPRPVARAGVVVVGVTSLWWLVSGLLSTAVNVLALGVIAYVSWWVVNQRDGDDGGGDDDDKGGRGGGGGSGRADMSLSEARRIMDKYK